MTTSSVLIVFKRNHHIDLIIFLYKAFFGYHLKVFCKNNAFLLFERRQGEKKYMNKKVT